MNFEHKCLLRYQSYEMCIVISSVADPDPGSGVF
jgi:hypothetical protein